MLALSRWKIVLVLGSVIFGLLFSLPNVLPDSVLAHWPGFLPHLSGRANLEMYWRATGRPRGGSHLPEVLKVAGLEAAVEVDTTVTRCRSWLSVGEESA